MGVPQLPSISSWFVGGAIRAMLSAISSAVDGAAAEALRMTGSLLSSTTSPGLLSSWFSATYWRVAALSALLTVPFLFAAAVHALVRSDLALLGRAAFGYLPLAAIGVTIAAPLTTLLLSATDEMCAVVASAAGPDHGTALARAAAAVAGLSAASGSPMLAFFVGLLAVGATIGLWVELLIRAAAVDVIVLLLPLFFAAMVWPARRVWAIRAIETLIALILSKFAIVAVLTLGGAAFAGGASGLSSSLVGATLVVLAVLSPWALLRLLPLHEVAAAAAGGLSQGPRAALQGAGGTFYDAVRGTGAEPDAADGSAGLSLEDDGTDALDGTGEYGAWAGGGRVAGRRRSSAHPARDAPLRFAAETAQGLSAVEGAGRAGARADGSDGGGSAAVLRPAAVAAGDDRPPIDEMFGDVEWEGFVIGEEGDEVMETPRFGAPSLPPGHEEAGAES
jgi:type IV secretion system protein TrbL